MGFENSPVISPSTSRSSLWPTWRRFKRGLFADKKSKRDLTNNSVEADTIPGTNFYGDSHPPLVQNAYNFPADADLKSRNSSYRGQKKEQRQLPKGPREPRPATSGFDRLRRSLSRPRKSRRNDDLEGGRGYMEVSDGETERRGSSRREASRTRPRSASQASHRVAKNFFSRGQEADDIPAVPLLPPLPSVPSVPSKSSPPPATPPKKERPKSAYIPRHAASDFSRMNMAPIINVQHTRSRSARPKSAYISRADLSVDPMPNSDNLPNASVPATKKALKPRPKSAYIPRHAAVDFSKIVVPKLSPEDPLVQQYAQHIINFDEPADILLNPNDPLPHSTEFQNFIAQSKIEAARPRVSRWDRQRSSEVYRLADDNNAKNAARMRARSVGQRSIKSVNTRRSMSRGRAPSFVEKVGEYIKPTRPQSIYTQYAPSFYGDDKGSGSESTGSMATTGQERWDRRWSRVGTSIRRSFSQSRNNRENDGRARSIINYNETENMKRKNVMPVSRGLRKYNNAVAGY